MKQHQSNENSGTTSKKHQRLIWIDCLRGLAAITVVIFHILVELQNGFSVNILTLNGIVNPGRISVLLFFMISGYVIRISTCNQKRSRTFFLRRFARLYPPYIICVLISILFCYNGFFGEGILNKQLALFNASKIKYIIGILTMEFSNLIGTFSPLAVDWTLAVELLFYFQIYIIITICPNLHFKYIYIFFIIVSMFSDLCRYFPFLYAGTLFWDYSSKRLTRNSLILLLILLPISCYLSNYDFEEVEVRSTYANCSLVAISIFSLVFVRNHIIERNTLIYLGKISYSLYLIHLIVIHLVVEFQIPFPIISMIVITMVLSSFCYKYVEEPSILFSRKL